MKILKHLTKRKSGKSIGRKDEVAVCTNNCDCTCGFLNPHDPKDRQEISRALQGVAGGKGMQTVQQNSPCIVM